MSIKTFFILLVVFVVLLLVLFITIKVIIAKNKKIKELKKQAEIDEKNKEILQKYTKKTEEVNDWKDKTKSKDYKDAIRDVVSRNNDKLQND